MTCDLVNLSVLQLHNREMKYILFCLHVFSKFLQVAPLTSKSAISNLRALQRILESEKSNGISHLFTDLGIEFYNHRVQYYLSSKNMLLYSNYSRETKPSLAERVI